jgi:hypothetical protein
MSKSWKPGALALLFSFALLWGHACAASSPLLDEVHTIAASAQAVPVEHSFAIATAGTYKVSLVDLGAALTPTAPLATLKLSITSGSTLVTLTLTGGTTGTQLTGAGNAQFSASPGTYAVHVIGTPGTTAGSGPIGITITNASDNTQVQAYSDTLALPSTNTASSTEAVLDASFSVPATDTYQVTLTDMQLPQSLTTLTLAIAQEGGSLVMITPPGGSPASSLAVTPPGATATGSASLQAGVTYRIFAVGQQTGTPVAGLFGVTLSPAAGGAVTYSKTVPVGAVALLGSPMLTAGTYTLSLADLQFPNTSTKLAQVGAAITLNGQIVPLSAAPILTATGSGTFVATATTYQVFGVAVPSSSTTVSYPGTGSYSVALQSANGTAALSVARAVSISGGMFSAYSFDTGVTTSQAYAFNVADFSFPAQFTSLNAVAVQNGVVLGSVLNTGGSVNVTPSGGPMSMLVFAQPSGSSGLFGVSLAAGSATAVFETTQAVGSVFDVRKVSIATAGNYLATIGDVGWPAPFSNLEVVITQGSSKIGQIVGSNSTTFAATPGDYYLSVIAQPQTGSTDLAGTYALTVDVAPPGPTITTFQSSPTSVASGGTVTLQWATQNATSCSLSGGGGFSSTSEPTSGNATSSALTATTTFTLTCTGAGGNTTQSVTVNITASSGGHGGGGAIRPDLLALLAAMVLLRAITWGRATPVMRSSRTVPTVLL